MKSKYKKVLLVCAFCNKQFYRKENRLKNSKSRLYFCNKKCKDEAQRIENGFDYVNPQYKNGLYSYRAIAFRHYGMKCESCDYDKIKCALEVHHIDGNRKNNNLDNLIVLCANCHSVITRKKGYLQNRKLILRV